MNAKDPDTENVDLGKMLVKTFPPALSTAPLSEGQVMLKHPNSNGMQLDINTGGYIPARFVKEMTVMRGNDLGVPHGEHFLDVRQPELPLHLRPWRR